MQVGREQSDGTPCYYAEVRKGPERMCRLLLVGTDCDEQQARAALADKARSWIAEYRSRHTSAAAPTGEAPLE